MASFIVEHDSPLTAWGQVQRDLRRRVETGEFPIGAQIPSEAALKDHYGVSRETVRHAIEALVADGYLRTRRGSGTFVAERSDALRCDIDLLRPWREQLLATGHVARSRLVETDYAASIPPELLRFIEYDSPEALRFGRHVSEVDGIPIAVTESWIPRRWPTPADVAATGMIEQSRPSAGSPDNAPVTAANSVQIAFASSAQAALLGSYLDVPLLVVSACSRLRVDGQLVEVARTSWLGSRVRFTYGRELTVGQIDMTELAEGTTATR